MFRKSIVSHNNKYFSTSARMPISHCIFDWDETITTEDTIKYVAEAAYSGKPNFTPPFDHFVNIYMNELKKYNQQQDSNTKSISREIQYQRNLKRVEESSIDEIENLNLFKGLLAPDFENIAPKVTIRPHFVDFYRYCSTNGISITILSVNWTSILIKHALKLRGLDTTGLNIVVNELAFIDGVCTGKFDAMPTIRTGFDKLEYVRNLHHVPRTRSVQFPELLVHKLSSCKHGDNQKILYVGDSRTDLLSMIESDVGVIFGKEATAAKARDIGLTVTQLGPQMVAEDAVFFTDSWRDIHKFVEQTKQTEQTESEYIRQKSEQESSKVKSSRS